MQKQTREQKTFVLNGGKSFKVIYTHCLISSGEDLTGKLKPLMIQGIL